MGMTRKKAQSLADQLRQAIADSGKSRYAISKATGVPQSVLSKFVHGQPGLDLETIERLAAYFGMRLGSQLVDPDRGLASHPGIPAPDTAPRAWPSVPSLYDRRRDVFDGSRSYRHLAQ